MLQTRALYINDIYEARTIRERRNGNGEVSRRRLGRRSLSLRGKHPVRIRQRWLAAMRLCYPVEAGLKPIVDQEDGYDLFFFWSRTEACRGGRRLGV